MKRAMTTFAMTVLFALAIAAGPAKAQPNLVQNGQFSSSLISPGGYVCDPTQIACVSSVTDWGAMCSSEGCSGAGSTPMSVMYPGTSGAAWNGNRGFNVLLPNSPDNGNMIGDDGDSFYRAPMFQTISGLSAGTSYALTFYQAADEQSGNATQTTEQWQVSLGSETLDSTLMTTPANQFSPWTQQTLMFTATAASEVLTFLSIGAPNGVPPVVLLADVSLTQAPEPGTIALVGVGLLGLVGVVRRRRRQMG